MEKFNPIALTIPDAVKATGMSRTAIYEALKCGDLTARKTGRHTVILFADLEAYIARLPTAKFEANSTIDHELSLSG